MPKLSWNELSDVRHALSNQVESLYRLELSVRDYFRGTNSMNNTCSCLNQIGRIKDGLISNIDAIDKITTRHEAEDE